MCAVLVVDDEPGVRRLLEIVLREVGCEVKLVPDAEAALAELEETNPDVVLTDVRLPGIDGLELAQRIHSNPELHDSHVILMSAYGKPYDLHGDDFVQKPFDLDSLVERVRGYAEAGDNT
jgi:CheY-like chemotaxis protein